LRLIYDRRVVDRLFKYRHKRVNLFPFLLPPAAIADCRIRKEEIEMPSLILSGASARCDFGRILDFPNKQFHYRYKAPRGGLLLSFIIQMQIGVAHCIIKRPCKNIPRSHRGQNDIKINSVHIIENNVLNNKVHDYIRRIHLFHR